MCNPLEGVGRTKIGGGVQRTGEEADSLTAVYRLSQGSPYPGGSLEGTYPTALLKLGERYLRSDAGGTIKRSILVEFKKTREDGIMRVKTREDNREGEKSGPEEYMLPQRLNRKGQRGGQR